ncbi:MAG: arsenite efflux transporter metallochaperone ArsD [Finegoldia sp.]|nr:arsenite efflux transporter metallochaperone ArsD [Finegoldia sp.]
MKKISIYEPAMCCPTGLCGVSVDPELLRISTVLDRLKKEGIEVNRYNLSNAPMAFMESSVVNKFINEKGIDDLPITLVDGEIVKTGTYLTNEEFTDILDLSPSVLA